MALATTAAVAGGTALAGYLNAKYHIGRELKMILHMKKAERDYARAVKEDRVSLWYLFEIAVAKHPNTTCLWSREGIYTWTETRTLAIQYAQWFLSQGVKPGELVAFYLTNSPELMIAWLGLWCIGCAPAFINYNLEGAALEHCLKVSEAKLLLVDQDESCRQRVERRRDHIETQLGMRIYVLDALLKTSISKMPNNFPPDSYRSGIQGSSPLCLIYTSGTTGLPKGCAFTIQRLRLTGVHLAPPFDTKCGPDGDRWYVCMPLYHGTGGIYAASLMCQGVSLAIGKRFSVSNFWKDIHDSQATFFVYVGETARYLLNAPPDPLERAHRLRCVSGNGLRPDVWERFRTRFGIQEIAEFFNSTEGMFAMLNWDRGVLHNQYVPVLIDHNTGDIYRDPTTGFAKRTPYEQGGEMIVKIPEEKAFQGYWNAQEATDKKFVRDVFRKGDLYYRTGDALRRDPDGRWYFLDRLGDTFRWKSENVSTAEVSIVLGSFPGVVEANVYGVEVPHHEGRAGCAALFLEEDKRAGFDYDALLAFARERLPRYAVPVFLRVVDKSAHIHNLKQDKVKLRKEGVDPAKKGTETGEKGDVILWLGKGKRIDGGDGYVEFTEEDWRRLQAGDVRL